MTCDKCDKYNPCKKPCQAMENILKADGIKSANWIRPRVSPKRDKKDGVGRWREIPFSSLPTNDRSKDPLMEDFRDL